MTRIVVGIDGGATSRIAAEKAIGLAIRLDGEVHFVTVVGELELTEQSSDDGDFWFITNVDEARDRVEQFLDEVGRDFVPHSVAALTGDPAQALVAEARRLDADLMVVGNADIKGLGSLVSTVAGGVAVEAPCDVLIAKTTG